MSDSPPSDNPPPPQPPESSTRGTEQGQARPDPQPQPTAVPPQVLAQLLAGGLRPGLSLGVGSPIPIFGSLPIAQAQQTVQLWQGQYPPPEAIEHYEKVLPGSFHRMISMAEQLQAAQIEEGKRVHDYTHSDSRRGHWLGFSAAVLAMFCALGSLAFGYPWVGVAFISVPVMGVAKALIDSAKKPSTSDLLAAATDQAIAGTSKVPTDVMPTPAPAAASPSGQPSAA